MAPRPTPWLLLLKLYCSIAVHILLLWVWMLVWWSVHSVFENKHAHACPIAQNPPLHQCTTVTDLLVPTFVEDSLLDYLQPASRFQPLVRFDIQSEEVLWPLSYHHVLECKPCTWHASNIGTHAGKSSASSADGEQFMAVLTQVSGGGKNSKRPKEPERVQSVRLSDWAEKRAIWREMQHSCEVSRFLSKMYLILSQYETCENASWSFLAVLASLTKLPASQPNHLIQLTNWLDSFCLFWSTRYLSFFDPPPVRFTIKGGRHRLGCS